MDSAPLPTYEVAEPFLTTCYLPRQKGNMRSRKQSNLTPTTYALLKKQSEVVDTYLKKNGDNLHKFRKPFSTHKHIHG